LPTIAGKSRIHTTGIQRNQEEASFRPDDIGDARSCEGMRYTSEEQPPSLMEPTAAQLSPKIGAQTVNERLTPVVDNTSIVGDGSDAQTLQIVNGIQALPKKKKKAKVVE
jgi:hypothetical protein